MNVSSGCDAFSTDAAYFQALQSGNKQDIDKAWICLYTCFRHFPELVLKALNIDFAEQANRMDAEDAYEESILAVVDGIQKGRITLLKARLSTYLFCCCKYQLLNIREKRVKFTNSNYTEEQRKRVENEINQFIVDEMGTEYQRKVALIRVAVDELRQNCSEIMKEVLYYYYRAEDIAVKKEIGLKSARTEISRCKTDLINLLVEKYKFPPGGLWL